VAKLNQIVALVQGARAEANKITAPLFHTVKNPVLFAGMTQVYTPAEEGGERLPDDNTSVKHTVDEILSAFRKPNARMLDLMSTNENANTEAFADVVVDGSVIIEHAPVTFLMPFQKFLEQEVRGIIRDLPVQDPAETWALSTSSRAGIYQAPSRETFRQQKVQEPLVLYQATDKHPAQTELITRDVIAGYWDKTRFTGTISQSRKDDLANNVERLIDAVKVAREEANSIDVDDKPVGDAVFNFLFRS